MNPAPQRSAGFQTGFRRNADDAVGESSTTILCASNQHIGGTTLVPVWKDPEF
jgi:hypothetical protein